MKWRALFEASPAALDAQEFGGLLFGEPASESDIRRLEERLGIRFPAEFREIYSEFNGVGIQYTEEEEVWWLIPLDQIEERTESLREWWFEDTESEAIANRMICFGDWFNGDLFGYVADDGSSTLNPEITEYNHELGRMESWNQGLGQFLQPT